MQKTFSELTDQEKVTVKRSIEAILRFGVHQVVFKKVDGTIRVAEATLRPVVITEELGQSGYDKEMNPAKPRSESFESCRFFEVGTGQWRSFKLDSLISIGGIQIHELITL